MLERVLTANLLTAGRTQVKYITGIDLGRTRDYTVLTSIACDSRAVEGFSRFNGLDWSAQLARIAAHLQGFPGACVVDAIGAWDPLCENIRTLHRGITRPFIFSAVSRKKVLCSLARGIVDEALTLPPEPILCNELRAYCVPKDGCAEAPPGLRDDCVISLALAWWGLEEMGLFDAKPVWRGNPFMERGVFG